MPRDGPEQLRFGTRWSDEPRCEFLDLNRRTAILVEKIIRGAKQCDLPVVPPADFAPIVDGKAAQALGIRIFNSMLVQTTRVIK